MKKVMVLFLGIVFVASFSNAGGGSDRYEMTFWEALGKKIAQATSNTGSGGTRIVGGVKATKNRAIEDLYWKDEEVGDIPGYEIDEFRTALDLVDQGKMRRAREVFEKFIEIYPDSRLVEDARRALERLHSESEGTEGEP